MAWQSEMTIIVRYLVNDPSSTDYTDLHIQQLILVAAQLVQHEIEFDKTYTVDVDSLSLSPDPTTGTKDNGFINLISLKSACMILKGDAKVAASDAFKITDGPSTIDGSASYKAKQELAEKCEKHYELEKTRYLINGNTGLAVMTPTTVEHIHNGRMFY